ncbi:MAG TPA: DUF302 domain-containing protein [Bryobacteraceae bacterium]|jgi:uncharacterized protein (DUF302 family)|nr:DUF302 domain-containing protein [Bryobacteraceae bacterium]
MHSVDETLARLQKLLEAKSVHIFAVVDHSGEAEKAGLRMPNTKLIIFGSPKAGTPLMLSAPTIAIDLPLKILIWEDSDGKVWLGYNSADFLSGRHHVPPDFVPVLAAAGTLASQASQ